MDDCVDAVHRDRDIAWLPVLAIGPGTLISEKWVSSWKTFWSSETYHQKTDTKSSRGREKRRLWTSCCSWLTRKTEMRTKHSKTSLRYGWVTGNYASMVCPLSRPSKAFEFQQQMAINHSLASFEHPSRDMQKEITKTCAKQQQQDETNTGFRLTQNPITIIHGLPWNPDVWGLLNSRQHRL